MRTLHLLRHAKSSWEDARLADHERPLDARGERAATLMGVHLAQCGVAPDLVLVSSARRALQTAERIAVHLPEETPFVHERGLYGADDDALLRRLRQLGPEHACVLLVAHNPGLHELGLCLVGAGDVAARAQLSRKLPTGAWLELALPGEPWSALAPGCASLRRFVVPKDLV